MSIVIGATYSDILTGFCGVAIGHVVYLTGCNQTLLLPRSADPSVRPGSEWFDDQRLERVPDVPIVQLHNGRSPGFDKEAPKR